MWDTAQVSLFNPSDVTKSTYSEYNGSFYSPTGGPDGRWAMYAGVKWWANNCGWLIELNHAGQLRSIPVADLVPEGSSCNFQSFALLLPVVVDGPRPRLRVTRPCHKSIDPATWLW